MVIVLLIGSRSSNSCNNKYINTDNNNGNDKSSKVRRMIMTTMGRIKW